MSDEFKQRARFLADIIAGKSSPPETESKLADWLSHPNAETYLGTHTMLKIDCLAHVLGQPGSLAAIARRYGVSRQAAHNQATAARKAFGIVHR